MPHVASPFCADSAVSGVPVRVRDRLAGGKGSGPTAGEEQEKEPGDKEQAFVSQIAAVNNAGI